MLDRQAWNSHPLGKDQSGCITLSLNSLKQGGKKGPLRKVDTS